ncbi:hypothetical protein C8Q79DRAFT_106629 [Trametes meyenii]|nr:hypothetical protein C8Q79DRAFT_106629 [Trametes meyenii]
MPSSSLRVCGSPTQGRRSQQHEASLDPWTTPAQGRIAASARVRVARRCPIALPAADARGRCVRECTLPEGVSRVWRPLNFAAVATQSVLREGFHRNPQRARRRGPDGWVLGRRGELSADGTATLGELSPPACACRQPNGEIPELFIWPFYPTSTPGDFPSLGRLYSGSKDSSGALRDERRFVARSHRPTRAPRSLAHNRGQGDSLRYRLALLCACGQNFGCCKLTVSRWCYQ